MEYNKTVSNNHFRVLLTANFQHMTIDNVNYPPKLSSTDLLKQTFLSDREKKFILASAPPEKLTLNPEYGYKKFTLGTRFTYFGKIVLLGYGQNFDGLNPQVPLDNSKVIVPDQYNYSGKVVSDLYFTYRISKVAHFSIGSDNIFNLHPNLGVVLGAKGNYAYNNEPGGPFDAVQMGTNGRRLFARIGFTF